jgi:hypothetical protein
MSDSEINIYDYNLDYFDNNNDFYIPIETEKKYITNKSPKEKKEKKEKEEKEDEEDEEKEISISISININIISLNSI